MYAHTYTQTSMKGHIPVHYITPLVLKIRPRLSSSSYDVAGIDLEPLWGYLCCSLCCCCGDALLKG